MTLPRMTLVLAALVLAPGLAVAQTAEKPPAGLPAEAPDPNLPPEAPARKPAVAKRRPAPAKKAAAPVAKKIPVETTLSGHALVDDYAWLKDKKNPEVIAYLEAENAYTAAQMAPTKALQDRLYKEMLARVVEDDVDVPVRQGAYLYAWRTEKGKPHKSWLRWKAGPDGAPTGDAQVLLDLNQLAEGKAVAKVDVYEVSDDGRLLAYAIDRTGGLDYQLYVKDLTTGAIVDGPIAEVSSAAWASDGAHLMYATMDAAKRPDRVWLRRVGTKMKDRVVYQEKDARFDVWVERSKDAAWLLLGSTSRTTTEVSLVPARTPDARPRVFAPRKDGVEYEVYPRGDTFFVRSNEVGRTYSVFAVPGKDLRRAAWKEVVKMRPDVNIDHVDVTRDVVVVVERAGGLQRLRFLGKDSGVREVAFADASYSIEQARDREERINRQYDARTYRVEYTSLTTPRQTIDIDMFTMAQTVKKELAVPGYDRSRYVTERIAATAPDGAQVPISLVYRKGLKKNGKNPLLLHGYGAYGITTEPAFEAERVSLLDRGVVYAIAHVRGSGDLGKPWHDAGRMLHKKNTFTDFIAAAEGLIAQKYTSKAKLAITGRSAGGLLIGAVVTMRPDLAKVALPTVPFVDVINSMLDESMPLTVNEFEEWGNPKKKDELEYMLSYSPYDNIKRGPYPAMLIRTGLNDNQVLFHEPAKFTARLRASKTDRNPLLLIVNMGAGHSGSSGRYDALREKAHDWAFLLTQLGVAR